MSLEERAQSLFGPVTSDGGHELKLLCRRRMEEHRNGESQNECGSGNRDSAGNASVTSELLLLLLYHRAAQTILIADPFKNRDNVRTQSVQLCSQWEISANVVGMVSYFQREKIKCIFKH